MFNMKYALTGALLLVGSATLASAQQPTATPTDSQAVHAMRGRGGRGMMKGARGLRGQLFKGITMSDAEKANIKNVHAKYESQMKALREQFKPQMQALRDARQRGDTAALKQLWQKAAPQREQTKQLLTAERNDLRAALTPANQATFDANVAAIQKQATGRAKYGAKGGIHHPPAKPLR
jgi:hypothetical protein